MRKGPSLVTLRHMVMSWRKILDMPPLWLLLFAVVLWWLGQFVPMPLHIGLLRVFGTGLVVSGIVLILLAAKQFRQHKTTIIPHQTASALLDTGVYAQSRNPIYLADALILAGLALRWDIPHGLLLIPIFMWVIQTRFILPEEARLRDSFGASFDAYERKVRRWV